MMWDSFNREALGLIPWIVGSWGLALAAGLLFWFSRRWGRAGRWLVRFLEGPDQLIAPGELFTLVYALGVPYAALMLGFVDAGDMGLSGFSWWWTLGRGVLLGGGLLLLAGWVWGSYLRAVPPPAGLLLRQRRLLAEPAGRPLLLLWAAGEQLHWAFYRSLPVLLWGSPRGLWIGMLLVLAERYALPRTGVRLRRAGGLEEEAWWLAKALALTAVLALLGNLWICILLHALLDMVVAWLVGRKLGSPEQCSIPLAERFRPALPALLLAGTAALLLSVLFTWGALYPRPAPPIPDAVVIQSTVRAIPTPTPTATLYPTSTPIPAPTATPSPTATREPTPPLSYVVQPGDTLNAIAMAFDVSVVDLMQVNGITDPDNLRVGQELIIP